MGPIWGRQDPGGPHVGPMNFAIWGMRHELSLPDVAGSVNGWSKYIDWETLTLHRILVNHGLMWSVGIFTIFHFSDATDSPFAPECVLVCVWYSNVEQTPFRYYIFYILSLSLGTTCEKKVIFSPSFGVIFVTIFILTHSLWTFLWKFAAQVVKIQAKDPLPPPTPPPPSHLPLGLLVLCKGTVKKSSSLHNWTWSLTTCPPAWD